MVLVVRYGNSLQALALGSQQNTRRNPLAFLSHRILHMAYNLMIPEHSILTIGLNDSGYPRLLGEINDPPATLFYKGTLPVESDITLAVVGTRAYTAYGKAATVHLVRELAAAGVVIVSGLARGIDGLAHRTALEVGGRTIAVIGSGLDRPSLYPREHWALAEEIIAAGGCVMSEYAPGTPSIPFHFPERNRIIAGLCRGTLVIEAPLKSGALITAYAALDYNREVLAVPQNIFERTAVGTNTLLRRGAHVVASVDDALTALGLEPNKKSKSPITAAYLSDSENRVLSIITQAPLYIDKLGEKLALPSGELASLLTMLELKGFVQDVGNKTYIRLVSI